MRTMMMAVAVAALAGCATARQGSTYAANPVVVGTLAVATESQCRQYAADHPEDAAALRGYLTATGAAIDGCVGGISAGLGK
jgi:hypothetical protein